MTTNFSNTVAISICSALCIGKQTHQPTVVEIKLPYEVDLSTAEKPVRKAVAADHPGLAFAMVTNVEVKNALCTLPISVFTQYAYKMNHRGENGRTREPVMTRTLESSICTALCIDKATKQPMTTVVTLPYGVDIKAAEKPVRKAVAAQDGLAFAMVTNVKVETAVYEMPVALYIALCERFGTVEVKTTK